MKKLAIFAACVALVFVFYNSASASMAEDVGEVWSTLSMTDQFLLCP